MESSIYGSDLVADCLTTEMVMEKSYKMIILGVPVDGPYLMMGDNISMILIFTLPSIALKNNSNKI